MSELIKRLRRTYRKEYAPTGSFTGNIAHGFRPYPLLATEVLFNPDGPAAADEIERLTAQLAEAREAFASLRAMFAQMTRDGIFDIVRDTVADSDGDDGA
jgi:hypothetical protein